MKAQETSFQEIIQGQKQFQVPLYQRTYSWQEKQLGQLWKDVLEQADGLANGIPGPTHFLGSIVLAPSPKLGAAGVMKWVVVDGQQRLTTLMLAMCALRDHLAATDPVERDRLNELYLINRWKKDLDFYRLLPTQADRDDTFLEQLRERRAAATVEGVERLLEFWVRLGGNLGFGSARETSCFLLLQGPMGPDGYRWWPFTLYPSGACEVVFQHLLRRPPFDDERLREEFRQLCNQAAGVNLPRAKLQLRPSFPLSALTDSTARERVFDALEWFTLAARDPRPVS
jgi:hypothetical protein